MQVRIEKDIRKPLKASAKKHSRSIPKEASRLIREKLEQEIELKGSSEVIGTAGHIPSSSCTS